MTTNDAQIAREWAERAMNQDLSDDVPRCGYRAAARHILATAPLPTMADVEWDDEVHAGLCAEHADGEVVRMVNATISRTWIRYILPNGEISGGSSKLLTPIPGTKINLTPRREPVPESTPDHPEFLKTEDDYANAPDGTIVAYGKGTPLVLVDGLWRVENKGVSASGVAGIRRRVLRWGWEA